MLNFALIGAAGYVAPKHMKAIKDVGGHLLLAHDVNDSVGVLDSYFKTTAFATNDFEFKSLLQQYRDDIDYFVVCTPNYEHLSHCYMGVIGARADVICEKPIVRTERELDMLNELIYKTGNNVHPILQMRYAATPPPVKPGLTKSIIRVNYYTPRGDWYHKSWKGDIRKSGGIATNIGIHLFDWLMNHYGNEDDYGIEEYDEDNVRGWVSLEHALVMFRLSTDLRHRPNREFIIDDQLFDLTDKFNHLHTKAYEEIINGNGLCPEDCRPSIRLTGKLRQLCM